MICSASLLLCGGVLLAPAQTEAAPALSGGPGSGLSYQLDLQPGERLLGYSWDGAAEIPYLARDTSVQLDYGESGARTSTLLHLPGNTDPRLEAVLTSSRLLASAGRAFGEGRFGRALVFESGSRLAFQLRATDDAALGWTISFWFRPEPSARGRPILEVPGVVTLGLLSDGRVEARLVSPPSVRLVSRTSAALGAWNHAALSFDAALLGVLRMVVNGSSSSAPLPAAEPLRVLDELVLGAGFVGSLDEIHVEDRAASTAQLFERGEREPLPGFHRLTLRMAGEWRAIDLWVAPSTDPVIDTAEEFARGTLEGACVEGGLLRWTGGRWDRLSPAHGPAARTTHPTVYLGKHEVLVFGGETRDTHFWTWGNTADTWILDTQERTWTPVRTPLAPSPRCHTPAAYSPDHDLVLLVGGFKNDAQPLQTYGDTWVFHVGERRWEERHPSGPAINPTSDHVLVYLPAQRRFLMLRGRYALTYDPLADRWEQLGEVETVSESGAASDYRVFGSTMGALDPVRNEVVLFGGEIWTNGVQSFVDTTAIHDPLTNTTTVLDPRPGPSARVRSGFAYDSRRERFVLFGGVREQYTPRDGDLWTFEPSTRRWSRRASSNPPSPRGGFFGMAYDPDEDRFFLACGRHSGERFLDETWSLALDDHADGYALYVFDRAGFAPGSTWFADVVDRGTASVVFRFRTSPDGVQWGSWTGSPAPLWSGRFVQVALILRPGSNGEVPALRAFGFR